MDVTVCGLWISFYLFLRIILFKESIKALRL